MPNEEPQYVSSDDVYKALSDIRHILDVHTAAVAEFITVTQGNVKRYKEERDGLVAQISESQEMLEEHIITEGPKLFAIQTKLNLALALVISACLFGLAGPNGLRQIADFISGSGIGADGIIALLGFCIPMLVPLGNRLFVRVVSSGEKRSVLSRTE